MKEKGYFKVAKTDNSASKLYNKGGRFSLRSLMLSLIFIFSFAVNPPAAIPQNKPVVAKVNGAVLTDFDLRDAMNEIVPAAIFHGGITPDTMSRYRPQAIELMIEKELYYQEAKLRGMKVDPKRIDAAKGKKIENLGGRNTFKKALKQWGVTEEEYEKMLEKKFLIEDINRAEIEDKAHVPDDEVKAYYERNKGSFVRPEAYRIRHILISVAPNAPDEERAEKRKKAEEVLKKIRAGEDIAELAWDYSDDPYRVKGGDPGLVHKGMLDPDLEKEVQKTKVGEISGIAESIYGYHIIKVEEKKPSEQLSLEDVSKKIKSDMRQKKLKELKEAFIARIKGKAKVEIF